MQVVSMPVRVAVDVVMIPRDAVHGEIPARSTVDGLDKIRKELEES